MLVDDRRDLSFGVLTDHLSPASGKGYPWLNMRKCGINSQIQLTTLPQRQFPYRDIEGGQEFDISAGAFVGKVRIRLVDSIGGGSHPIMHRLEQGALKEEVILTRKPSSGFLQYTLHYPAGTQFLYQGALTPGEIDGNETGDESWRPEWVVGSFAIFDITGFKIGHIFRPLIYEAADPTNYVWGTLELNGNALKVHIPASFNPPGDIVVDPTVGYTSKGGTEVTQIPDALDCFGPYIMPEIGSVTTVSIYYYNPSGNDTPATFGCYDHQYTGVSPSRPSNKIADSPGADILNAHDDWVTRTLDSPVDAIPRIPFWVASNHDTDTLRIYYDTDASFLRRRNTGEAYSAGNLVQPANTDASATNRLTSAYGTYTAVAGGGGVLIPVGTSGGARA